MNLVWKYVNPTTKEIVDAVSKENGFKYPNGLQEMILEGNNGCVSPSRFRTKNSINEIKTLLSYNVTDKENIYCALRILREDGCSLLPFANTPAGDLICTDGSKVVLWSHESSCVEVIAETFDIFKEMLF